MITLILPGYSKSNKSWADEVAKNIKVDGQIRPIFWDHWGDPTQKFKASEKANLLVKHSKGDAMNIIAKSIGSLVASYITKAVPNQINKIILCGIPTRDLKEESIKKISEISNENLIVFQNDNDPHGNFEEVKKLYPNFNIVKKIGDTHDYPYFEDFQKFLDS